MKMVPILIGAGKLIVRYIVFNCMIPCVSVTGTVNQYNQSKQDGRVEGRAALKASQTNRKEHIGTCGTAA